MLAGELHQVGHMGHATVLAQDLADGGHGTQAGEIAQVRTGFCVARATQHAPGHGAQREHVPGPHEIA